MERWSLAFQPEADKDLAKLDWQVRRRVIDKLDWLLKNFDVVVPSALSNEFGEFYKLRVGDFRVIYKINWNNSTIFVCYIDRRDKIYKKR